jgi:hypothetical protein
MRLALAVLNIDKHATRRCNNCNQAKPILYQVIRSSPKTRMDIVAMCGKNLRRVHFRKASADGTPSFPRRFPASFSVGETACCCARSHNLSAFASLHLASEIPYGGSLFFFFFFFFCISLTSSPLSCCGPAFPWQGSGGMAGVWVFLDHSGM